MRQLRTPYPQPNFVVIDISWVSDYPGAPEWFFSRFPVKAIIETFASIPTYNDCNDFLWDEVEMRFTADEMQKIDFMTIELVFELLIERFYLELNRMISDLSDAYVFHSWLDHESLLMVKSDCTNKFPVNLSLQSKYNAPVLNSFPIENQISYQNKIQSETCRVSDGRVLYKRIVLKK